MFERIRRVKTEDFSIIDNAISRDSRVKLKERGLWMTVMCLPDDWDFTIKGIIRVIPDGRDIVRSCVRKLIRLGYCTRRVVRKEGRFNGYIYTFLERSPEPEKPEPENPPQSNIQESKEYVSLTHADADTHTLRIWGLEEIEDPDDNWDIEDEDSFEFLLIDPGERSETVRILTPKKLGPTIQGSLLPLSKKKMKKGLETKTAIPAVAYHDLYEICFSADTEKKQLTLDSTQRGRVASVLGRLREAGADFRDIQKFRAWWSENWRSRDKVSLQYQAPRPEQVLENWWLAIESGKADLTPMQEGPIKNIDPEILEDAMMKRAMTRKGENGG